MKSVFNKTMGEAVVYGLTGLSTSVINLAIYHVGVALKCNYKIVNLAAILTSKIYGYLANKIIVFQTHCLSYKELAKEIGRYAAARGVTGIVDYFGLIACVQFFHIDRVLSKYIIQILVIILNYIMSKKLVFEKTKEDKDG